MKLVCDSFFVPDWDIEGATWGISRRKLDTFQVKTSHFSHTDLIRVSTEEKLFVKMVGMALGVWLMH